jgi:hypothetical protein
VGEISSRLSLSSEFL